MSLHFTLLCTVTSLLRQTRGTHYLSPNPLPFSQAEAFCVDYCASHLLSIHSEDEYLLAQSTINRAPSLNYADLFAVSMYDSVISISEVWIGLHRPVPSEDRMALTWTDGSGLDFGIVPDERPWHGGDPNNNGGNESCVHLWAERAFLWNDYACDTPMRFLCADCADATPRLLKLEDAKADGAVCVDKLNSQLTTILTEHDLYEADLVCGADVCRVANGLCVRDGALGDCGDSETSFALCELPVIPQTSTSVPAVAHNEVTLRIDINIGSNGASNASDVMGRVMTALRNDSRVGDVELVSADVHGAEVVLVVRIATSEAELDADSLREHVINELDVEATVQVSEMEMVEDTRDYEQNPGSDDESLDEYIEEVSVLPWIAGVGSLCAAVCVASVLLMLRKRRRKLSANLKATVGLSDPEAVSMRGDQSSQQSLERHSLDVYTGDDDDECAMFVESVPGGECVPGVPGAPGARISFEVISEEGGDREGITAGQAYGPKVSLTMSDCDPEHSLVAEEYVDTKDYFS